MNVDSQDYINVYSDVLPEGLCAHLINEFRHFKSNGIGVNRQKGEGAPPHIKNDYQIFYDSREMHMSRFQDKPPIDIFWDRLQNCYNQYADQFSMLRSGGEIFSNSAKFQETVDGGGYHVWHCEQGHKENASRVLAYMLYLNTLPEEANGETEFLYQKRRVTPKENTIVIWPAAFTHPHRGNPVYGSTSKYIITGWFCYKN